MTEVHQPFPYTQRAFDYVAGVLDGSTMACRWIRLACERHANDLRRSMEGDPTFPYRFDPVLAERVCKFVSKFPHVKGKWAAKRELFDPQPWQCFWYASLFGWVHIETGKRRFRKARCYVPRKNGKAVHIDTPVATTSGWKAHGELAPGDYVFAPDGRPVMVEAVGPRHQGPCRRMTFSDGEQIIAHDAHEWVTERTWFTGRRHVGYRWGQKQGPLPPVESRRIAETLRGGARGDLVHRIPVAAPLVLPAAEVPLPPYVLGAWLGDGTSNVAQITSADPGIVERIRREGVACVKLKATYLYRLGDGDGQVVRTLRKLGVLGSKHIPAAYLRASVAQRLALLQGLVDTDGTVSKAGQTTFFSTSVRLAEDVAELVRSLGMKAQWTEKRAKLNGRDIGPRYDVQFWANEGFPVASLQRKVERLRYSTGRARTRMVTGADPAGEHEVNCIQVEGGLYLVGRAMVTTHNSLMVAPLGLYMLTADGEPGAEVYSGATTEKQAWEVFGPAKQMASLKPAFLEKFGVQVNAKSLTMPGSLAKFELIIGKPGDGSSPHCSITDEYHEHADDSQLATMETGMGAREQPLSLVVSTAGDNLAGPCRDDWLECQRMLQGTITDDTLFALVYTVDVDDEWASEASLRKANPNFGVSVSAEFLLTQLREAVNNARKQGHFKIKHLNVWVQARDAYINVESWRKRADPTLRWGDYAGRDCFMGMDLASKTDLVALEFLFPEPDGSFVRFGRYYLPRATVDAPENDVYRSWEIEGLLQVTEGNLTDYFHILEDIKQIAGEVCVKEIAFDPHNATMLVTALEAEGLPTVEFGPTVLNFSEPMKQVEALVRDGKLKHNGDKVMEFAMSNVVAKADRKDNVFPNKERPENKIDPFVALCMAMGRYMAQEGEDDFSGFLNNPVRA